MKKNIQLTDLTIEIVQSCPNQCIFCSSFATPDSPHLISLDEVRRIGNEAVELGLKKISISGGEPLLHPEIFQIVNTLSSIGLDVSIYTIGQIKKPNGEIASFDGWHLFKNDNPKVIFNIQSTESTVHDFLAARKGAFQRTFSSLECAVKDNLNVEVHLVPNKTNLSSIESTANDLITLGVKKISFLRLVPQGYARKHLDQLVLSSGNLEYLQKTFSRLDAKYGELAKLRFGIPFSGMLDDKKQCNAGKHKLIIRYDGKVLPCEAFKDSGTDDYILGDIRKDSLLEMLLKGDHLAELSNLKARSECTCESCPAQLIYG